MAVFLALSFQNCGQGFKAIEQTDLSSSGLAPVCTSGATEQGFVMPAALYPLSCGAIQMRTCVSGQWDNASLLYPSCKQQCIHPETKQAVDEGTTFVSYNLATANTQAQCEASKVTSVCDKQTGQFVPAVASNKSCLSQGQICSYPSGAGLAIPTGNNIDDTVVGYSMSSATYPAICGTTITSKCQASGSWSPASPLYTSCVQKCIHPVNSQPVNVNTTFVFYTISIGTQAQCDAAKVTSACQNTGLFLPTVPSTYYTACTVMLPASIASFNATPTSVPSGEIVTLNWDASNATSLTINPGMINVTGKTSIILTPAASTTYTLTASNSVSSTVKSVSVTVTGAIVGQALYEAKCANCHGSFAVSTLKGRTITTAIIQSAISTKISAMKILEGTLSTAQIDSITELFVNNPGGGTPLTSNFACTGGESEKNSSVSLIRLNGRELKNSYIATVGTSIWNSLANYHYLLPPDKFDGNISNFVPSYTFDMTDQISRFNEQLAAQLVLSNANISSFFGSCATSTSFTKTCFDAFLAAKGPQIFRSALNTDDNASLWSVVTQAGAVTDQLKILVQLLYGDARFLFHLELGEGAPDANGMIKLTSYEVANRIAFGLTGAPPTGSLWTDATQNKLTTIAAVSAQVDSLSQSPEFRSRVIDFVKYYVGAESTGTAPTTVTEFMSGLNGTGLESAATNEFNNYVDYIVFSMNGSLKDLYSSRAAFPGTQPLATIMGTNVWTSGQPMMANNYVGILTRPYMNLIANPNLKLVQRGKRIRINMLCTDVPQPSAADLAARPLLSDADLINLNRRDYIDKATLASASCIVCHSKMNQLGYATENYDSIGRFITTERIYNSSSVKVAEHPVVSSSKPAITETDSRVFANVDEFQNALTDSDVMHQCLSRKAYQFLQRVPDDISKDSCRLNKMDTLIKQNKPIKQFIIENFKQQSVLYRRSN